jgi:hypothetical protein
MKRIWTSDSNTPCHHVILSYIIRLSFCVCLDLLYSPSAFSFLLSSPGHHSLRLLLNIFYHSQSLRLSQGIRASYTTCQDSQTSLRAWLLARSKCINLMQHTLSVSLHSTPPLPITTDKYYILCLTQILHNVPPSPLTQSVSLASR